MTKNQKSQVYSLIKEIVENNYSVEISPEEITVHKLDELGFKKFEHFHVAYDFNSLDVILAGILNTIDKKE
jgi:hypothetical protein